MKSAPHRWILLAPLLLSLTFAGCGEKRREAPQQSAAERLRDQALQAGVPETEEGLIPGQTPVWAEGTELNRQTLESTIVIRTQGLDALYRRAMARHADSLAGQVSMKLTIYPDGTVGPVEVLEAEWNVDTMRTLTDSMRSYVETWTFPPGLEKPFVYTQPWRFRP